MSGIQSYPILKPPWSRTVLTNQITKRLHRNNWKLHLLLNHALNNVIKVSIVVLVLIWCHLIEFMWSGSDFQNILDLTNQISFCYFHVLGDSIIKLAQQLYHTIELTNSEVMWHVDEIYSRTLWMHWLGNINTFGNLISSLWRSQSELIVIITPDPWGVEPRKNGHRRRSPFPPESQSHLTVRLR